MAADLTTCDREPIRVPGAIQPHGYLVVLGGQVLDLKAWSANWDSQAQAEQARDTLNAARLHALHEGAAAVSVGVFRWRDQTMAAWGHRLHGHVIVEFEVLQEDDGDDPPIYGLIRDLLPKLQGATSVQRLLDLAAKEFQRLSGFGRCVIYRFDEEGHGEVLAEAIEAGYQSYAGLHFPASDIPAQARELYLSNRFRLIPDARYQPVPLLGSADVVPTAIDLSNAFLRSVSPVHLEYMRNMGTLASMSVSIVVDGKLWGLASCHNHDARPLAPDLRAACSHFGQLLSMQIEAKVANAEIEARLALRKFTLEIVAHLSDGDATLKGLTDEPTLLLRMARATGAAVVLDESVWTAGDTPAPQQITDLADWIYAKGRDVYETDRLASEYPAAEDFLDLAGGVLCLNISRVHRHVILWFRPEVIRTVTWAGNPAKNVAADGSGRIHPRRSFESWVEQFRGRAIPWSTAELAAAAELRQALIGIVLKRAEEVASVANELGRVNKELEAFSYSVSHDLRAPMRHIAGYVDLVLDADSASLSSRSGRYLGHVKDAAAFAGQLVDALLDFSRMGRSALKVRKVSCDTLVRTLVAEYARADGGRRITWHIEPGLPTVVADPVLLQVAVRNLLGNAVKYSRSREVAVITVRPVLREASAGLEVEDNGVGFQMQYVGKLFGVFQRLHKVEEFEGTGIGLANVKRVVERHGGEVWARGEPDVGAVFGFALPTTTETTVSAPPAPSEP